MFAQAYAGRDAVDAPSVLEARGGVASTLAIGGPLGSQIAKRSRAAWLPHCSLTYARTLTLAPVPGGATGAEVRASGFEAGALGAAAC